MTSPLVCRRPSVAAALITLFLVLVPLSGEASRPFDDSAVATLRDGRPAGARLRMEQVVLGDGSRVTLNLERFEVWTADAEIVVHSDTGERRLRPSGDVYFRGVVEGDPSSLAFFAVGRSISGFIVTGSSLSVVGPPTSGVGGDGAIEIRAVDAEKEFSDIGLWTCGSDTLLSTQAGFESTRGPAGRRAPLLTTTVYNARLAIETDFELYSCFNSDSALQAYVANLVGAASAIYYRDIRTNLTMSYLSIWKNADDPWKETTSNLALNELRTYWETNRTAVQRSAVHLLSGKAFEVGGLAELGALCTDSGYGVERVLQCPASTTAMHGEIVIFAHEVGHTFNSPHTQCYVPPVDQCDNTDTLGTVSCYRGPVSLPPDGGTIMSYCHKLAGGFANVIEYLGKPNTASQAVLDRMRSYVESRTACLGSGEPYLAGISATADPGVLTGRISVTLNGPAPTGGIVVALRGGSAFFPVNMPASVTILAGQTSLSFPFSVNTATTVEITGSAAGYSASCLVTLPGPPLSLSSVTVSPSTVSAGQTAAGTATLTASAPTGGVTVGLSSNSTRVTVPGSVNIPAGATSQTFDVSTTRSRGTATVTITGAYGTSTASGSFQLQGWVPRVVEFRQPIPASVGGTQTATGTISLDAPADAGGVVVNLASDKAAATVPAAVTVPQGQTSVSFTINTSVVSMLTTATLSASYSGGTPATTTLIVLPPAYEGYFDSSSCSAVSGWAWDAYRPNTPINVDLYDGSMYLATVPANGFRPDLLNAGKGNGYHAFAWTVPPTLRNGANHPIWAMFGGTTIALAYSPRTINCPPPSTGIYWVYPSEVTWGPPATLTVAGYAKSGSGGPQMFWRDITANPYGAFNTVAYIPTMDANGVWYNTIPSSNKCHTYEVKATYSGVNSAVFTWVGSTSGYCVSTIQVTSATYGLNCGAPSGNATWSVAPACNGLTSCSYTVKYQTLGDPAPGCAKDFRASWTCSGGTTPSPVFAPAEAGLGSVVTFRCP